MFLFAVFQKHLKRDKKKKLRLIMDVVTRWNSTHDMMERYLQIHPQVYAALTELKVP
jgi:hypothetical protein